MPVIRPVAGTPVELAAHRIRKLRNASSDAKRFFGIVGDVLARYRLLQRE